jgi:hypothetical protein
MVRLRSLLLLDLWRVFSDGEAWDRPDCVTPHLLASLPLGVTWRANETLSFERALHRRNEIANTEVSGRTGLDGNLNLLERAVYCFLQAGSFSMQALSRTTDEPKVVVQ